MYSWKPYVSVAKRKQKAAKVVSKMLKKGEIVSPVLIEGRTIAKSFWGKAWCAHLESLGDYENRLPRGRTYARNGSVIHLTLSKGLIQALVQGSSLYKVSLKVTPAHPKKWDLLSKKCSGQNWLSCRAFVRKTLSYSHGNDDSSQRRSFSPSRRNLPELLLPRLGRAL